MGVVFDDISRNCNAPAKAGEGQFSYLNRSNRIEAERVRLLVEDFISRYPSQGRPSLVQRLRSRVDHAHFSAFYELFLHEILIRTGNEILEIEPNIENSTRRPDFIVRAPDKTIFLMEAVTSMGQSSNEAAAERRLNEAVNAIDECHSIFHFLDLQILGTPKLPVTISRLKYELGNWIQKLPKTEIEGEVNNFVYKEHGMTLIVGALFRKNPQYFPGRAIGLMDMHPYWVTDSSSLRDSIYKKARYGDFGKPYIVAINSMSLHDGETSCIEALFGSLCMNVKTYIDGSREISEGRNTDGIWWGKDGPHKKGLSAVFSTERLTPWSLSGAKSRLIINPWANHLITHSFCVDEITIKSGLLNISKGRSIGEILDLPIGWPGH